MPIMQEGPIRPAGAHGSKLTETGVGSRPGGFSCYSGTFAPLADFMMAAAELGNRQSGTVISCMIQLSPRGVKGVTYV
jgi:hypothetical protein